MKYIFLLFAIISNLNCSDLPDELPDELNGNDEICDKSDLPFLIQNRASYFINVLTRKKPFHYLDYKNQVVTFIKAIKKIDNPTINTIYNENKVLFKKLEGSQELEIDKEVEIINKIKNNFEKIGDIAIKKSICIENIK